MLNKIVIVFLFINILSACTSKIEQNNIFFLEKYGSEVDRINTTRERGNKQEVRQLNQGRTTDLDWRNSGKILGIEGSTGPKTAFIDTSKIKPPKKAEPFLPDLNTLRQGRISQSRVPQIFNVSYLKENSPKSYRQTKISFEDIKIPKHDYFGINSSLENKKYINIANSEIQSNIDQIHQYLNKENKEINLILLKEKQQIREKKTAEFLGLNQEVQTAQLENKDKGENKSNEEAAKKSNKELPTELPSPL